MGNVFKDCINLRNIKIGSNFITKKVAMMSRMFANCTSLSSLDLSNFDTAQVTTMEQMFKGCTELVNLRISQFKGVKLVTM